MRFDRDSDGKVTARELPERMARLLEEGDANKDGTLDGTEIETLSRRQPARRPGPPGDGPPGPGDLGADDEDHGRPVAHRPAGPGQQPTEAH